MTVCKYWQEGDCWHGSECWYDHSDEESQPDHYHSLKRTSSTVAPAATAPTPSAVSASASSKPISAAPTFPSALERAIARLPELPSISGKATTIQPVFGWVPAPQAMSGPPQRPKSPESTENTSTTVVTTNPPELLTQELKVAGDVESKSDEITLLEKIAALQETVGMLEAYPERQSFKNDLLREELNTASEKNRELQIDVKALHTQKDKLRVRINKSETRFDNLEKINATLSRDLDKERKDSHASRTKNEVYLKALQEMKAISTKATATEAQVVDASRERSDAHSLTVCKEEYKPSLDFPQLVSSGSSPCTSALRPADSACSKTSSLPVKPPFTSPFGTTSRFGAKTLFTDLKKPSIGFGFGYIPPTNKSTSDDGPGQPSSGLPPSITSAPSSIDTHEAQPPLKRKIEETEGSEGDQIHGSADATTGSHDGQSKKARTAAHEENNTGDSGRDEPCTLQSHLQRLLHNARAQKL